MICIAAVFAFYVAGAFCGWMWKGIFNDLRGLWVWARDRWQVKP